MKTFLIAAGVLMTGASVYGVVDYNNRQHTKEFRELYKEQSKQEVPVTVGKVVTVTPVEKELKTENTEIVAVKKEPAKTVVKKTTFKKKEVKKKNRTLRLKEFSRAPLKD